MFISIRLKLTGWYLLILMAVSFLFSGVIYRVITGDEESLAKLFTILLDNAIKYTPSGGRIMLQAKARSEKISISVSDTGIGVTKKDLPRMFDRFFRADSSRGKETGFGLGLSIAKRIVATHKGTISVASKIGQGTTFIVKLPLSA